MNVQIIAKPAFAVLGIEGSGPANRGTGWIKPLWSTALNRIDEIRDLIVGGSWGLMSAVDEPFGHWKEEGKYLAGWKVNLEAKAPAGWSLWKVPKTTFAKVACMMSAYEETMRYVERFLKNAGYEQTGAIHEFYPSEFENTGKDTFYFYFIIKSKQSTVVQHR